MSAKYSIDEAMNNGPREGDYFDYFDPELVEVLRAEIRALRVRIHDAAVEAGVVISQAEASKGPRGGMDDFWRGAESAAKATLRRLSPKEQS